MTPALNRVPAPLSGRALWLMLTAAAFLSCAASPAPPKRLALVIGNSSYVYSDPLPSAVADARKVADKLTRLGFNLNKDQLADSIRIFGENLKASGENVVGFFYYEGHAAQDAFGVNYLLPIGANAPTPAEIQSQGVPVQILLQAMEDTDNAINIVVLDACRDWYSDPAPSDPKGLRDMGRQASMLIAYATGAGQLAKAGSDEASSPFSRRFLEAIDEEASEPIVLLFDDVKSLVYQDTDSEQQPLLVDGLTVSGRWSFKSGSLHAVANKPQPAGKAMSAFLAQLDRQRLVGFFRGHESLVDTLLAGRGVLEKYQINNANRLAYFLGAIGFETGGFKFNEERFGYSATALRNKFPNQVTTDDLARKIAGNPEMVANLLYANRLGNGPPESGDGWKYRGRGVLGFFITGRANYLRYGQMVGVDLINAPDLVNDPEVGFAVSAAVWSAAKANDAADADDLAAVSKRLRGGASPPAELQARAIWLAQAKRAVSPNPAP
jgi:putative chitinase